MVFTSSTKRHKTRRSSRKLGFNGKFTIMAFIQLAARRSVRNGVRCLEDAGSRLHHWGLKKGAPLNLCSCEQLPSRRLFHGFVRRNIRSARSKNPEAQISFQIQTAQSGGQCHTIKLCFLLFPRASFRKAKGGMKMQTLVDHNDYIPRLRPSPTPKLMKAHRTGLGTVKGLHHRL